jgi:multidrug efflux pump subunit AcrA (membrane-fusion protein)
MLVKYFGGPLLLAALAAASAPTVAAGASSVVATIPALRADTDPSPAPAPGPIATGSITAQRTYGLAFGRVAAFVPAGAVGSGATAPGTWLVTTVDVRVGDHVTRGQVLAVADTTIVQAQLTATRAARDLAQARLDRDLAKPTAADRAAADTPVRQAQLALSAARRSLAEIGRASCRERV